VERCPALMRGIEERTLARVWSRPAGEVASGAWAAEMAPYLGDPFRGARERRHLRPGEGVLALESAAAREALDRAGLAPRDVDLVISTALLPDQIGIGQATFLCRELGLRGGAWNLESACSSTLVALEAACALVQTGRYQRILIVQSCAYSRVADADDTFGWFLGDAAAAFVIGEVPAGEGLLATATRHTAETCSVFRFDLEIDRGAPRIMIRADESAGPRLAAHQDGYIRAVTSEALARAGVDLDAIALCVVNTPTAWFHRYFAAVLEIDPARTLTTFPQIANVGPALLGANLHHAASQGRIVAGDLVLAFTIGSVSSTAAAVLRWGDVALGFDPLAYEGSGT
jgi:3-oxoacyl-[acyl-carrier-protein] synthase-3